MLSGRGVLMEGQNVILHTTDGGLTWSEQLRTGPNGFYSGLDFVSATTGWVSRGQDHGLNNGILFTSDGGATWTEQTYSESGAIDALDFISPTEGWGVGNAGTIIHTEDAGGF